MNSPIQFSVEQAKSVLRKDATHFDANLTGAQILVQAATIGVREKACVVVVDHPKFSVSSHGYSGRAVLVNSSSIAVPRDANRPGTELTRQPNNPFVLLKTEFVKPFMGN